MRYVLTAAAAASMLAFSSAVAAGPVGQPMPKVTTAKTLRGALRAAEAGDLDKAIAKADRLLARDLPDYDRSLAHEMRGAWRGQANPDDLSGAVADFRAAVALDARSTEEQAALYDTLTLLIARADGFPAALRFAEANPDPYAFSPGRHDMQVAKMAYGAIELGTAEEALARAETHLGPSVDLLAFRYGVRLLSGRPGDGKETLVRLRERAPYLVTVKEALAQHDAVVAGAGDLQTLADYATELRTGMTEEEEAYGPLERIPPKGFERCIRRGSGRDIAVVVAEFAVTGEGTTDDVRVVDSSDDCFDRSAVEAIEGWRYTPVTADGEPFRREGIRVQIKYYTRG